jgi:imidazolonepropionase-like amidohydrolase
VAASPVTVTGGHCWFMGGEADSEDDLRRLVRTHHKHGADLIKVMSTGGFMTTGSAPWYAQFTVAQLAVIVEEAQRVGMPVAAHAHGIEGIRRAVEAGVSTLEHCSFVTETNERRFDENLAAMIAERGIVVCPTVNVNAPYVAELTGIVVGENLMAMRDMGVRISTGTDAVIAGGRDYVPDGGRFDVSAPGTPFASPGHGLNLELLAEATRRRQA